MHLRQTYHFGPHKIAMYLRRYHELVVSVSGIWRILRRLGLSRLPASQRHVPYHKRWQRYEKPEPGHQLQLDVKFIAPLKGSRRRHYQFTAIDDCTRLRVLRVYERLGQKTGRQGTLLLVATAGLGGDDEARRHRQPAGGHPGDPLAPVL